MVPTGAVTFLFSDIEGSTIRWETNREAMQRALRRHDEIVHSIIGRNGGHVFKTVGDEFCTAFQDAPNALAAALAIQQELAAEDFTDVSGLRVRIALHRGRADERGGDYYGPPVNRVARLLATGHGGQVLVSGAVAESAVAALPAQARLIDLGWHRLKDLEEPEHIFQLAAPGLDEAFAPLRSLDTGAHNLPRQTTTFVGREADVIELRHLLREAPLVSVVGAGGVGKTRLALQVAAEVLHEFRDGVWFVDLAPISDPDLVASTILSSLGVGQSGTRSAREVLLQHLATRDLLIVLDNCEHLIHAVADVAAAVLAQAHEARLLATTREALNITGETVYRLQTLGISEAAQLFIDRARSAAADFTVTESTMPVVEEICRRVDGLALAIELAATRVRALSLQEIDKRLDARFRILRGGDRTALPRQQTLHALIDWSHELLNDVEKILFRRLAVFSGSFTLDAVTDICSNDDLDEYDAADVLLALVDKSLVVADGSTQRTRYRLLQSIQDYAIERIDEAHEGDSVSQCHATYFARFAESAYEEWDTNPAPDWLARSGAELDNIRGALSWTISEEHDVSIGERIVANALPIFLRLSLLEEAIDWAQRVLSERTAVPVELEARLQLGLSMLYNNQLDETRALDAAERAAALFAQTGDVRRTIHAYGQLAQTYSRHQRFDDAQQYGMNALTRARSFGDERLLAITLQRAAITYRPEEIDKARAYFEEAVTLFESIGRNDETGKALMWWAAAEAEVRNMNRATQLLLRALPLVSGDVRLFALLNIAEYSLLQNEQQRALASAKDAFMLANSQRHTGGESLAAAFVAAAGARSNIASAMRLYGFARSHFPGKEWPPPQYGGAPFEPLEELLRTVEAQERSEAEREGAGWTAERALAEALTI